MICPICRSKDFIGSASVEVQTPYLPVKSPTVATGLANVEIDMIFTCCICQTKMTGVQTVTVACKLDSHEALYPRHIFNFVRDSYTAGWEVRAKGHRLSSEDKENPSKVAGWAAAQAHSESRGGKAPSKGWGKERSRGYLKTETACQHLKMISLSELNT